MSSQDKPDQKDAEKKADKPTHGEPATGPVKEPAAVDKDTTTAAQEAGTLPEQHTSTAGDPIVVEQRRGMFGASTGADTSGYGGLQRPVLFPGAAARPYGGWFDQVADDLERAITGAGAPFEQAVTRVVVDRGEMTMFVEREALPMVARALRDEPNLRFEQCLGVFGAHFPQETGTELHAIYMLRSLTHGARMIRLEVTCPETDPHIPSVVETYPSNNWHERETWDMFGIIFDGHPALTRILMPDDWPGHPQRKDYPLGGIPVEYKGATVPPPDQRRSYN